VDGGRSEYFPQQISPCCRFPFDLPRKDGRERGLAISWFADKEKCNFFEQIEPPGRLEQVNGGVDLRWIFLDF
jgi:hypothetical protein